MLVSAYILYHYMKLTIKPPKSPASRFLGMAYTLPLSIDHGAAIGDSKGLLSLPLGLAQCVTVKPPFLTLRKVSPYFQAYMTGNPEQFAEISGQILKSRLTFHAPIAVPPNFEPATIGQPKGN